MAISFNTDKAYAMLRTTVEVSKSVNLSDCNEPQKLMADFEAEIRNGDAICTDYEILDTKLFFYEYEKSQEFDEVLIAQRNR